MNPSRCEVPAILFPSACSRSVPKRTYSVPSTSHSPTNTVTTQFAVKENYTVIYTEAREWGGGTRAILGGEEADITSDNVKVKDGLGGATNLGPGNTKAWEIVVSTWPQIRKNGCSILCCLLLLGKRAVTRRGGTRLLSGDSSGFRMAKPGETEVGNVFQT